MLKKKFSYVIEENEIFKKKKNLMILTVLNDYFFNFNFFKIICLNLYTCCNVVLECWERSLTKGGKE